MIFLRVAPYCPCADPRRVRGWNRHRRRGPNGAKAEGRRAGLLRIRGGWRGALGRCGRGSCWVLCGRSGGGEGRLTGGMRRFSREISESCGGWGATAWEGLWREALPRVLASRRQRNRNVPDPPPIPVPLAMRVLPLSASLAGTEGGAKPRPEDRPAKQQKPPGPHTPATNSDGGGCTPAATACSTSWPPSDR